MRYLALVLFFYNILFASPIWYYNLEPINSYEFIGYGEGKSYNEARLMAKKEIATQIQGTISATSQKKVDLENEDLTKSFSQEVTEQTKVMLSDVKVLHKAFEDEVYYIALSYDNLPIEKRFAKKLKSFTCKDEKQNLYLARTLLFQKLNSEVGCKLDIDLVRKDRLWYIAYKDVLEVLPKESFEELFTPVKSKALSLKISSPRLREGDEFFFTYKASKSGYISLFNIYEDGTVSIVFSNQKIVKNKLIRIPSKQSEEAYVAGLIDPTKEAMDGYIAILSKEPLELSRFVETESTFATGENNKKFDELIYFLKDKTFASVLVRTYPR